MFPVQCQMARVALGLGVRELATLAKVAPATISRLEAGEKLKERTVMDIKATLEAAGIRFIDGNYSGSGGPGVRLASPAGASIDVDESQTVQYEEHLTNDAPPGAGG